MLCTRIIRRRCSHIYASLAQIGLLRYDLDSPTIPSFTPVPLRNETLITTARDSSTSFSSPFSSHSFPKSHSMNPKPDNASDDNLIDEKDEVVDSDDDEGCEETGFGKVNRLIDGGLACNVMTVVDILRQSSGFPGEMREKLEQCEVVVSTELVVEILRRFRNDWEAAFTFFLWAGKQGGYKHSIRAYHSMISILGKMRKFDTAWSLIDEMRCAKAKDGMLSSLVNPQTLLIMIRKYCAVHDVSRAINTFYAYKKYSLDVGMEEFQGLLSALCRYKNVQDAEHLMFCNRSVFPLNTKSFNIILNGWCNVIVSPREGERVWREMAKRGVAYDVISFSSIISCYSKSRNLNKVMKLYEKMKSMGIDPDRKVYNAVIHALAKGRLVKESMRLVRTMEENGIAPNMVTYNSLIKPLCKALKMDEAKLVFNEMLQHGLCPTVQTCNAFLRVLRTEEDVFELLGNMEKLGCFPNYDTYIMLIRKFSRWRQLDNVYKLWNEMGEKGMSPDRSSYISLIHGLFWNGKLEEAYKYYVEMKEKQFSPEPKTDEMFQAWLDGKQVEEIGRPEMQVEHDEWARSSAKKFNQERNFLRQYETRKVVRERGYSFWEK